MTVTVTDHFGFIGIYNAVPSTNDWACTYWNWLIADEILYGLISHTHDGATALQSPTGTLSLSTAASGGYLPAATTYYIAVTYLDDLLRETTASTVANVTTGAGISRPDTPTIDDAATPTDIQECPGGLSGGDYWYKISYVKGGGETLPSLPVYVSIPTDTTYECTIHFESLNDVGNGADAIYVYRKIGNTGNYVKLAEITAGSTNSYTDDNTGVPTCDKSPVTSSTINSAHTITIDWSALDYSNAYKVRIFATTTEGVYPTNALVAEVTINDATPVTSYVWTGTARTVGKPPEISHCFANPPKINLTGAAEIQGNLPWANLPSDFTWKQPVADLTALNLLSGIAGEARVVEDEDSIYVWDDDAATPTWKKVGGLKEVDDYEDLPPSGLEEVEHGWVGEATTSKIVNIGFLMATSFEGNGTTSLKAYVLALLYGHDEGDTFTVDIRATSSGHPAASALYTETYTLTADDIATWGYKVIEFDFGEVTLTEGATYWLTYSNDDDIYVARPVTTTKSRWESNDGGASWAEYTNAGLSYKLIWGTAASYTDAYLVKNESDIYTWSENASAWSQAGKKLFVTTTNPPDWTEVSDIEGVATGDFLLTLISENSGSQGNLHGLYVWRGDWSTPAWQRLNWLLPPDYGVSNNYDADSVEEGTAWLEEAFAQDGMNLKFKYGGVVYSLPLSAEKIVCDNYGYYGWYDTPEELDFEPNYGYGSVAFVWQDKSFYYYDDEIATPAWVRGPGVVKLDNTIDDVEEDATPTAEQLKINEILQALRDSGLIAT